MIEVGALPLFRSEILSLMLKSLIGLVNNREESEPEIETDNKLFLLPGCKKIIRLKLNCCIQQIKMEKFKD